MLYDRDQSQEDYDSCWDELINQTTSTIQYNDYILGPQGAAAMVKLPEEMKPWFQVPNSSPHVTLLIAAGYESHNFGPIIKKRHRKSKNGLPLNSKI